MLRLANENRVSQVTILEDTILHLISLTLFQKEKLLGNMASMQPDKSEKSEEGSPPVSMVMILVDAISPAIKKISGPGVPEGIDVKQILEQIEDMADLQAIFQAVVEHCSLTVDESKNSLSSSEQPTPDSAGSVEKNAVPEKEPVSVIPVKTEA